MNPSTATTSIRNMVPHNRNSSNESANALMAHLHHPLFTRAKTPVCRQKPMIARNQQLAISEHSPDEVTLRRVTRVSSCSNSSSHSLSASECFSAVEVIPPSKFWPSDNRSPCSNENGHGQNWIPWTDSS